MQLKVLHITNAYPNEGTPEYGVFVKEQIESLPKDQVISDVVFINGREHGKRAYWQAISEIRKKSEGADVVHCHHAYSFFVAALSGMIWRKPIVLSFLNDWTYEVKGLRFDLLKELACRFAVRFSSKVIFKSPVPSHLSANKNVVNLPNGVDGEFFSPIDRSLAKATLGLDQNTDYLLFVSSKNQYREQKRYDIFAKVLESVKRKHPDRSIAEIVMVGQPRHLIPTIFSAASVHVLTSDYEGSPNSVKESLCCGTPVVARDVGNVRDMLTNVPGALVVATDDPEIIASDVSKVITAEVTPDEVRAGFLKKGITKQLIASRLIGLYNAAVGRA